MNYRDFFNHIDFFLLKENKKQAKLYVEQGKLTQKEYETLLAADPTSTKKYVGWMAKQWMERANNGITSTSDLANTVSEYDVFVNKNKTDQKDITKFATFVDLKKLIDELNQKGTISFNDLKTDYETVQNDDNLLICIPHTHEASRYLGLSKFAYRDCKNSSGELTGDKDSAWCITYATDVHFNDYYYKQNYTLYYIRVKSEKIMQQLIEKFKTPKGNHMQVVAILVDKNGKMYGGWEGTDQELKQDLVPYLNIITLYMKNSEINIHK